METETKLQLEFYATLLDGVEDTVMVLDAQYNLMYMNRVGQERMSQIAGDPVHPGDPVTKCMPRESHDNFFKLAPLALDGTEQKFEFIFKVGREIIVTDTRLLPINLNGNPGVQVIATRKTLERKLKRELILSERRFESVVDDLTEMVVRWKPNGIRTFVNKAYCEAYGITEELAIGTSFFALIADEDHQDVRERIANLSPENPVSTGIHKITRPDGTRGWNEWTDRAFFDHRGKIKELQSTGRDISKLMESNMIFQDMLDKCLVGVYIIVGGKVVMVNREFCRIFGYEQAEISSLDLKNLVHPDYHTLIEEKIQKRLDGTAENRRYEFVAVRKDQQQRWVEVLGSKTLYGGKEAIIGTVQDITDRKGNLEELISSRAKLETILEHTRNQYFLVDLNFKIISYNKAAEDYANLEYSHRTLDQDSILSFIRPEKQEAFINMIEEVKSGKVVTYVREDKGIRNRWFEISLIPVKTGKKVTAFVLSGEDITTKKMAEAELLSRIELFKDLSFITSHELRTEYARLHALLGSIKDIGAFNPYVQKLITESQSSFKKLNESIFKLNNKINFSHRTFMGTILQMPEIDEIVLVEDDEIISTVHESLIQSFTEVDKILHYNNADDSMDYLKANRDRDFLVFLDLSMPGKSGWDFLDELNELDLNVIVVILSGSIDLNDRIRAADYPQVREFLSKPLTREIVQKIFDQMTTPV